LREAPEVCLLRKEQSLILFKRLSAIATQTKKYVETLDGYNTKIIDTRKNYSGMRLLEKWAVKVGEEKITGWVCLI